MDSLFSSRGDSSHGVNVRHLKIGEMFVPAVIVALERGEKWIFPEDDESHLLTTTRVLSRRPFRQDDGEVFSDSDLVSCWHMLVHILEWPVIVPTIFTMKTLACPRQGRQITGRSEWVGRVTNGLDIAKDYLVYSQHKGLFSDVSYGNPWWHVDEREIGDK